MNLVVEKYCEFPTAVRKPMWQVWHKMMIRFDKDVSANFMNYGYQSLDGEEPIALTTNDEKNRYCIQLYDHVVNKVDLYYKDILEVGSGRGGGASYISRYYDPKSYVGMDISANVIDFCNRFYTEPILSFIKGEAENLAFEDESFDCVVNVESARCYGSMNRFFKEVYRVLRHDGYFLFADMISPDDLESVKSKLSDCGFELESITDITKNVVLALDKDSNRRELLINAKIPVLLKKSFNQFAGTKGSERYDSFSNGKFQYWSFVLKKVSS